MGEGQARGTPIGELPTVPSPLLPLPGNTHTLPSIRHPQFSSDIHPSRPRSNLCPHGNFLYHPSF